MSLGPWNKNKSEDWVVLFATNGLASESNINNEFYLPYPLYIKTAEGSSEPRSLKKV